MLGRRALAATAGGIILLWAAGLIPLVRAQAPPPRVNHRMLQGVYLPNEHRYKSETGDWKRDSMSNVEPLYIKPDLTYHWDDFYGEYQIVSGVWIRLCGRQLDAVLPASPSAHVAELTFQSTATAGQGMLGHIYVMKYEATRRDFPKDDEGEKIACTKTQARSVDGESAASQFFPWMFPLARRQSQTDSFRAVNGEIMLVLYANATDADQHLWSCLATRGAASVEFLEPGTPNRQSVYVWPDGRFRTRLHGGTYQWRMLSEAACGPPVEQRGESTLRVPAQPAQGDEKAVLACFVSGGRFTDCAGWWLRRP